MPGPDDLTPESDEPRGYDSQAARVDEEIQDLERGGEGHRRRVQAEELAGLRQIRRLRYWMFCLLVTWLVFLGVIVVLQGASVLELEPAPMATIIGSGTIPVAAILVAMLGYIFSRRSPVAGLPGSPAGKEGTE